MREESWEDHDTIQLTAQRKYLAEVQALQTLLSRELSVFLTEPGSKKTNIIITITGKTYALPSTELLRLYEHLVQCRKQGALMYFLERQGTYSGLMLDYVLILNTNAAPPLEPPALSRLCHRIFVHIQNSSVLPVGSHTIHFFFTLYPAVVQGKYGFHVLIPGLKLAASTKKSIIRSLQHDATVQKILHEQGVANPVSCLDPHSASVPSLLYGSSKLYHMPYQLQTGFALLFVTSVPDYIPIHQIQNIQSYILLSVLCLTNVQGSLVRPVYCAADIAAAKEEEIPTEDHSLSILLLHVPEARYLHTILYLLPPEYYVQYPLWSNVVFALANTSAIYRPLAEWFSQKCPAKWNTGGKEKLQQLWNVASRHTAKKITKRSIMYWAHKHAPQQYKEIVQQGYFSILAVYVYTYIGMLVHYMFAKVIYAMLGNKFVVDVDSNGKYVWFEFVLPGQPMYQGEIWKWRKEVYPDVLHIYISENFSRVLDRITEHIKYHLSQPHATNILYYYTKLLQAFVRSTSTIFIVSFTKGVIRQAEFLFRQRSFIQTLDTNPHLLGVGNGVLSIATIPAMLIIHFHEHPIHQYTHICYVPFIPANPWTKLLLYALQDIIPELVATLWIMFYLCTAIFRGLQEALLLLWLGGGCNGKTFLLRLVAMVLGDHYASKLNITLLTSYRETAEKPNSAFMRLMGRGYGYFVETNKSEVLYTSRLQEMVYPGDVTARELIQKQESFQMSATMVAASNYIFIIVTTDHGTWRRLRHYRSKVQFCHIPVPNISYEKKEDPRFIHEYIMDPNCQNAFFSILVYFWEKLQKEYNGQITKVFCPTIASETEAYRKSQDTLHTFITERIVESPSAETVYNLSEVVSAYAEWYNANIIVQRHIALELSQELQNSVLQKYLQWSPNKTRILQGCRILHIFATLQPGESYIGVSTAGTLLYTPICEPKNIWWEWSPIPSAPPAKEASAPTPLGISLEACPSAEPLPVAKKQH
uniref:PC962R n=1 Tax=African swine fever virus TaxID=10497 RepID=A0A6G7KU28_ASF